MSYYVYEKSDLNKLRGLVQNLSGGELDDLAVGLGLSDRDEETSDANFAVDIMLEIVAGPARYDRVAEAVKEILDARSS